MSCLDRCGGSTGGEGDFAIVPDDPGTKVIFVRCAALNVRSMLPALMRRSGNQRGSRFSAAKPAPCGRMAGIAGCPDAAQPPSPQGVAAERRGYCHPVRILLRDQRGLGTSIYFDHDKTNPFSQLGIA